MRELVLSAFDVPNNENVRRLGIGSTTGGRFLPKARITCIYKRKDLTSYFTSFKIVGNDSNDMNFAHVKFCVSGIYEIFFWYHTITGDEKCTLLKKR